MIKKNTKRPLLRDKNPKLHWPSHAVTFRLPGMTAREALNLIEVLGQLDEAIWRVYGDAMADEMGLYGIEWHNPDPPDAPLPLPQPTQSETDF
jgi:hypothetical protein